MSAVQCVVYCYKVMTHLSQYFDVGVLMEEEIPQGLELIGKGVEQDICAKRIRFPMKRIVPASLLRLAIGYLFLCSLFLTVVQETTVINVFFDVLALQFVENVDDVVYGLCKRGFFGRVLRIATNNTHIIRCSSSNQGRAVRRWSKRLIRFVYFANILTLLAVLAYLSERQRMGQYRCESVSVNFGGAMWEDAHVLGEDKPRLLIYSHFNGFYVEDGSHDRRPRYVEMNKEDGDKFAGTTDGVCADGSKTCTVPAEIIYCEKIESWVLRHGKIRTSNNTDTPENECSWLLRSPETDSYDIIELAEEREWFVWRGLIETNYRVSIECNECNDNADCNYNGKCAHDSESDSDICVCDENHFGVACQFQQPCEVIRSEKDSTTTLTLLADPNDEEGTKFVESYGRPVYVIDNMSGKPFSLMRLTYPDDDDQYFDIQYSNTNDGAKNTVGEHKHYHPEFFADDDFFEVNNQTEAFQDLMKNYTFVLRYTGNRWYGQIEAPGFSGASFKEEEYHGFWNNAFSGIGDEDNRTLIISAPTADLVSPVGVDFYEMRRRNLDFETDIHDYDYSPYGVLILLVEYEGSGFFHCNKNDPATL
mmetsp:Transcript_20385/g.58971  ORF Transcript_20385/g.58971 Transcript_20385/m.58971 type:complete len:591 (-) Transcript_20385:139-1911(-)